MKKTVFMIMMLLIISFTLLSCQQKVVHNTKAIQLFNGKDLSGWYTFTRAQGVNVDTAGIFTVQDGMLRILGKDFGYICTKEEYANYTLTVEFKWGEEKFVPEGSERNSGILYNFPKDSTDRTWPYAVECQLMHGNMGDYVLMGPSMIINGEQGGPEKRVFAHSKDAENPVGEWNTVQVITTGDGSKHMVNGELVNQGTALNVHKGKILIQSEGAELFVRKVELVPNM